MRTSYRRWAQVAVVVPLGLATVVGCVDAPPRALGRQYVCASLCALRQADGSPGREAVEGRAESRDRAWRRLEEACRDRSSDRSKAELQVVLDEVQEAYRAADPERECRQE